MGYASEEHTICQKCQELEARLEEMSKELFDANELVRVMKRDNDPDGIWARLDKLANGLEIDVVEPLKNAMHTIRSHLENIIQVSDFRLICKACDRVLRADRTGHADHCQVPMLEQLVNTPQEDDA